ncbi:MAG TPA: hypothetical protein VMI75_10340, partial [Polyangiaceae bacterium]|nr:hypothetical protein [Polyangiaceae bacterium]
MLFDGDQMTSLIGPRVSRIHVTLARPTALRGMGVFGAADGELSVAAVVQSGKGGVTEIPLAGLQNVDLSKMPLRWNRFWTASSADPQAEPMAGELILTWRPRSGSAGLRDVELWGTDSDREPLPGAALADELQLGLPEGAVESWAEPEALNVSSPAVGLDEGAVFRLHVEADPRLLERAFLVYELSGLPHFSAAIRQINGFSKQGGFRPEYSASGGLQVEEIAPEWLFAGDNEVTFYPVDPADPVGYRVRRVRVVGVPGLRSETVSPADHPKSLPTKPGASALAHQLAALLDRDPTTGLDGRAGTTAVTLPSHAGDQPAALTLHVTEALSGSVRVTVVSDDGRERGTQDIATDGLSIGWHSFPLGDMPPGLAVRVIWEPGKEGGGRIAEARLATSPYPDGEARQIVVTSPRHGECVDHQAFLAGFVRPMEESKQAVRLFLGDEALDGAIAPDGSFALVATEPTRGKPWTAALRARFADGDEVATQVTIDG